MDIGRSFTFPLDDKKWISRIAVGALLTLASVIPVVNIFTLLVLTGYGVRLLKQVADGSDTPMPEWNDWGADWIKGLLVAVAAVIYSVPIWLLSGVGAGIEALARSGATEGVIPVCVTGVSCLAGLWGLAMGLVLPAAVCQFAKTGQFSSFFRFGEILGLISNNLSNYVVAILISIVAGIVAGLLVGVFVVGALALGLILSVVGIFTAIFWASLVSWHLFGQVCAEAAPKSAAIAPAKESATVYGDLEEVDFAPAPDEDAEEE